MTRTRNRSLRSLALAATLSALAAPAASALPAEVVQGGPDGQTEKSGYTLPRSFSADVDKDRPGGQEKPATPVRVVTVETDGGFDWGDAGIGAGSGLALVLVGVGSALVVRHRPGRSALAN